MNAPAKVSSPLRVRIMGVLKLALFLVLIGINLAIFSGYSLIGALALAGYGWRFIPEVVTGREFGKLSRRTTGGILLIVIALALVGAIFFFLWLGKEWDKPVEKYASPPASQAK